MSKEKSVIKNIEEWANVRNTSIEIAEVIFELAQNDEVLAEKIWQEGLDEVLPKAFAKTTDDILYWGDETIERKNV